MPTYQSIHTHYGLRKMAAAEALGKPVNLTHMAVGDGGGNDVRVAPEQTQLVREKYRAKVNRVYQRYEDPNLFTAELVIPADVAGFTIREACMFDADGGMFTVANIPAVYKPMATEGSYADSVIRLDFMVSNAQIVTLQLDPNVAVASQAWIVHNITPATLLPGGTTGQVLRKRSNADGDTEWHDLTNINVVVETVEEAQMLVANQVNIDLQYATTKGLAVYIAQAGYNGERLPKEPGVNGWQPDPANPARVILGRAYAGAKAICVQNEPLGSVADPLAKEKNLSDLENKGTARTNLDVYSKSEADAKGRQPGDVFFTAAATAPPGSMKANGAAVSRTAYARLFERIGTRYGKGDGFNTFNLPDLRAEFIRGLDDGRGVDAGRELGSGQTSQNLAHNHTGSTDWSGSHSHGYVDGRPVHPPGDPGLQNGSVFKGIWEDLDLRQTDTAGSHWHSITTNNSGGTEARPRNVAMLACIQY